MLNGRKLAVHKFRHRDTPRLEVDPIELLPEIGKTTLGERLVIGLEAAVNQLALMPNHRIVSA